MSGSKKKQSKSGRKYTGKRLHQKLIHKIQQSLSLNLRHSDYPVKPKEYYWACLGQCYVATEAAYYLFGRAAGYVPHVLKHSNGGTHWWLVHKETKRILDPTKPQLKRKPFAYEKGHRASFLTKKPSLRARELMRRVKARTK